MKNYIYATIICTLLFSNLLFAQVRLNDAPKDLNAGLNDLSEQISKDLSENRKQRIAVVEFVDLKGEVTDLGRYLSEKLITNLFKTKKFRVVERQLLNKIIKEQKLSLTGIIDPTSAQKLGRLLGVDAIAAGSISDLTKTFEINARLISTETGEVFSAASVQITKDETVCNLMGGCNGNTIGDPRFGSNTTGDPRFGTSSSREQTKPKSWKVESNFFTFDLHICRRSGTSVICEFTITNNDKDRELRLSTGGNSGSNLYDQSNNKSASSNAEIANSGKSRYVATYLISGFNTKARIYFDAVSPTASLISSMWIRFYTIGDRKEFYIEFKNIPLS